MWQELLPVYGRSYGRNYCLYMPGVTACMQGFAVCVRGVAGLCIPSTVEHMRGVAGFCIPSTVEHMRGHICYGSR